MSNPCSITDCDTCVSPAPAVDITRAASATAIPEASAPRSNTEPLASPARTCTDAAGHDESRVLDRSMQRSRRLDRFARLLEPGREPVARRCHDRAS